MAKINNLSLAALRAQINAGTRTVTFPTDDGAMTQMVYIPKFTLPTGSFDNGAFPAADLNLGGFFIDKYACSHKAATATSRGCGTGLSISTDDTTNIPVSLPGKVAWTDIDWTNAKQACANRKINGAACHLVKPKERATVVYLSKLLGHEMHGNNSNGYDYRDGSAWANCGVPDPVQGGRMLTGTGPLSWSHNGMENGVFDMCGNIWEWEDLLIQDGVYTHKKTALINDSDGITAADTTITIDTMQDGANWPTAGTIQIEDEYITYGTLSYEGNGKAVLSNCTRGAKSSKAAVHANDATVYQLTDYCVAPDGVTAYLAGAVDASTTSIAVTHVVNGPQNNGFAVGNTCQIDNEKVTITAISGNTLTVTRGANGSTAATHAAGAAIVKDSSGGHMTTLRTETDLADLCLPKRCDAQTGDWCDGFWINNIGSRAAERGARWGGGSHAQSGAALDLSDAPSSRGSSIGFRAALSLTD